jgi:hypothetical protein
MTMSPSNARSYLSEYLSVLCSPGMGIVADPIPVSLRGSRMSCYHCPVALVLLATSKMKKICMLFANLQKLSEMPLLNTRSVPILFACRILHSCSK